MVFRRLVISNGGSGGSLKVLGEKVRSVNERRIDRSLFIEPAEALLYRHVLTLTIKLIVSLAISYTISLNLVLYVNALAYYFKNVY